MSNGNWTIFLQMPIAGVLFGACAVLGLLAVLPLVTRKDWRGKIVDVETEGKG
jgi:hypothetical protein